MPTYLRPCVALGVGAQTLLLIKAPIFLRCERASDLMRLLTSAKVGLSFVSYTLNLLLSSIYRDAHPGLDVLAEVNKSAGLAIMFPHFVSEHLS